MLNRECILFFFFFDIDVEPMKCHQKCEIITCTSCRVFEFPKLSPAIYLCEDRITK